MSAQDMMQRFQQLWADLRPEDTFSAKKPLLAHYTSIQTLEKILASNEVWFSNPLFMNDLDEVRFGILQANEIVLSSSRLVDACKTQERALLFKNHFTHFFNRFVNEHALDIYVFCLSNHSPEDNDGRLSMWRGYGADGNGACIVFDTAQIEVSDNTPLIISQVSYDTTQARLDWLRQKVSDFETLLAAANVPDDELNIAAYALFERIKIFALFTKHRGFLEEDEWRIVYLPDRDHEKRLHSMFNYFIGPRGVEPKLRFKISPIPGLTADDLSLSKITQRIILGPSISTPLAYASVRRMLDLNNHPELKSKLRVSSIPFRSVRY
ncbi:DUF2971 domain-containing protein [Bradyrhizobium oligotrophicum S58]